MGMGEKRKGADWERAAAWLFYVSVFLECVIVVIDKSNYINPVEGQLFRLTFLLLTGKVLLTKYSKKEWMAAALFGALGFLSYKATGRNEILRIVVFLAAYKNMDGKKVLKCAFYTTFVGCALLAALSVTGIYGVLALESDFGRGYLQTRYCLGLGHPNALHCMFMMLALLGLYLYNEKMKWYFYLILLGMNYGLYLLTDSNTGTIVAFLGIAGAALMHYWKGLAERKWVYWLGAALFLACVCFSVLAADERFAKPSNYWFENRFVASVETHLNGRVKELYYGSIERHGTTATWSLFSKPENNRYFDMGFVRLFYWYGIVPGTVYIILYILLLCQCAKKKDGMGLVMAVAFAIYTIVEAHLVSVYIGRNYILFLMGMYMSDMLRLRSDKEGRLWEIYRLI